MIEAALMRVLMRKCPNYRVVSERFAKDTFSLCTCRRCEKSVLGMNVGRTRVERTCKPLLDRLIEDELPIGYAVVCENGTCDAASFIKEDNSKFRLEGEQMNRVVAKRNRDEAKVVFKEEDGDGKF